jgi:protein subunit release factor B
MGKPTSAKGPRPLLRFCRVDTFRAGGKGGQHQNKVETGIRLTHEPTGITAISRRYRSRHRNMEEALRTLERKLAEHDRESPRRVPTAVPPKEKRRRREEKRRKSQLKRLRKRPDAGEV